MSATSKDRYLRALHRRRTVLSVVLALVMVIGYSGAIGMEYWRWAELGLSPLLVTWSKDGKYYASARGTTERWDHPSLKRIDKRTYELSERATALVMLLGLPATLSAVGLGALHIVTRHPYFDEETGKAGPYWDNSQSPPQPPPVPDPEGGKRL
jgi:hypothetical protein